jgi:hypothetical protein
MNVKLILICLLMPIFIIAQNKGISYQAVLLKPVLNMPFGEKKSPLSDSQVCLKFVIFDSDDNIQYQEIVSTTTDLFGMVNVKIGNSLSSDIDSFENIDWNKSGKSLQVSIDFKGVCEDFEVISKQNFSVVPFAKFASSAEKITGIVPIENGGTNATSIVGAKENLLLNNVDNTSDVLKPISTATSDALLLKEDVLNKSTDGKFLSNSDEKYPTERATKTYIDAAVASGVVDASLTEKGKLKLAGDIGGTADLPTIPGLALKEPIITKGQITDYFRGDKSFQPLDKNAVGLNNVDNTSDFDKPISNAALNALLLKEDLLNKSTDGKFLSNSDEKYPTEKATKTYVDTAIVNGVPDASSIEKGKLKLAGDIGGTADLPIVNDDAITTIKIKDANVTDEKIVSVSGSKITGDIVGNASNIVGLLAIENGGTGSDTKNFVDLKTKQSVQGDKIFDDNILFKKDLKIGNMKVGHGSNNLLTNTIVGSEAFNKNISGEYNTALGLYALNENLSSFNTAIGHYTLVSNTTGYANTALGAQALFVNKTGRYNLAAGVEALARNTTGENNTAIGGYDTMLNNITGNDNTALGYASMYTNVLGSGNVGLGINTLYENVSGNSNIAIGASAGYKSTDNANIYIGFASAYTNTKGSSNIYIGTFSGTGSSGSKNIVIGDNITNENPLGDNQLNIGNIIKGNLINGDIEIKGNIIAKNFSGNNTGNSLTSKPIFESSENEELVLSNVSYSNVLLQVVIEEAGNYLTHFNASYGNNTQGATSFISIFVDDQIVQSSERRDSFNNASESKSISSIAYLRDLQVGQVINVKCKVDMGEAKIFNRSLIVQKN